MSLHRDYVERLFAEHAGLPLADFVAQMRAEGASWRAIERHVFADTQGVVSVSSLSLKRWFDTEDKDAA